ATSKVFVRSASPIAVHPKIHGTRMRCPELETGANSVAPCTRPRMIAWRMLTRSFHQPGRRENGRLMLAGGRDRKGEGRARREIVGPAHGDRERGEGRREREAFRVGRADEHHESDPT